MQNCPCGSEQSYDQCCQKFHKGELTAPSAEILMKTRYSAFAMQEVDYIMDTFHPRTRAEVKRDEIGEWAKNSDWKGLQIVSTENGTGDDSSGFVEFKAKYEASGKKVEHHEKSFFEKEDGKWFFVDGEIVQNSVQRDGPKIGRNDPCPCGSGKKHKKCCL